MSTIGSSKRSPQKPRDRDPLSEPHVHAPVAAAKKGSA